MPLILFANVNWYIRYRKVCWFGVILLSKKMCRAQLLLYVMYTQYMKGPGLQDNCLQWSRSHGSWKGFLCCVLCVTFPKEGILSSRLPDWGGGRGKILNVWNVCSFATTAVHAADAPRWRAECIGAHPSPQNHVRNDRLTTLNRLDRPSAI